MELKTLKDIFKELDREIAGGEYWMGAFLRLNSDLKQEAINYIKEIYVFKQSENKEFNDFMGRKAIYSEEAKQGMINFIKYFFNIKESDLEDEKG